MSSHFNSFTQESMRAFGERLATDARNRQQQMNERRSGVNALMGRFEQARKARAEDRRQMSREFQAACDAFRRARRGEK